jgi:hypothetical protein
LTLRSALHPGETDLAEGHQFAVSLGDGGSAEPPTAVLEGHVDAAPQAFTLQQNYPNPFNPETTIRFDLPTPEDVELAVYNLAAQKVVTLVRGFVRLDRTQCGGMAGMMRGGSWRRECMSTA